MRISLQALASRRTRASRGRRWARTFWIAIYFVVAAALVFFLRSRAVPQEVGSILDEKILTAEVATKNTTAQRKGGALVHHEPYNGPLARPFLKYPHPLPCSNGTINYYYGYDPSKQGMYYTKLSKCSSSTLAGIAVQIARNEAKRQHKRHSECMVRADHGIYRFVVQRPDKSKSMLWTFVREPARRQVSDFFHFFVSRRGYNPHNDTTFQEESLKALKIVDYMTGGMFYDQKDYQSSADKVEFIMNAYDFIGLVDRYHESLVLLKLIYNLDLRDILYTSAKRSGGYDDGEFRNKCTLIQPSIVSPNMKSWFQDSTEWSDYAKDDILLYRVVDKSIDLSIENFGRATVENEVHKLELALKYANDQCAHTAVYPCSGEGSPRPASETTCVAHDWACAHECIESLDLSRFEEP